MTSYVIIEYEMSWVKLTCQSDAGYQKELVGKITGVFSVHTHCMCFFQGSFEHIGIIPTLFKWVQHARPSKRPSLEYQTRLY